MRPLVIALLYLTFALSDRAESIRERMQRDPSIQLYTVIFGITQNPDGTIKESRVVEVDDLRTQNTKAVKIDVPAGFLAAAQKAIREHKYELRLKDGQPVEFFTYFFYSPQLGDRFIDDLNADLEAK
jgi:hypothetical protein